MIIVDDFYSNPQEVRDFALKAKYSSAGSEDNFPGSQSLMPFYNKAIINKFESILGCEIIVDLESHLFGQFRLSLANSSRKTIVHLDDTQWAAVIYLTLDDYRQGGTHLFQHLDTGISCVTDESMARIGMTRIQFEREIVMRDSLNMSKWKRLISSDLKFNRMVLIEGSKYLHGVEDIFGQSFQNGRLTQHFFFNCKV